jgi:uncharacterized coiled-coil protein SlyX
MNWLPKIALKGQWRTKRVEELEVKRLLAANAAQECTIQSLSARVAELERNEGMCARTRDPVRCAEQAHLEEGGAL